VPTFVPFFLTVDQPVRSSAHPGRPASFTLQGRLGNQLFTCHAAAYAQHRWQREVDLLAAPGDPVAAHLSRILTPGLRIRTVPGLTFEGQATEPGIPRRLGRALRRQWSLRRLRPHWIEGPHHRPEQLLDGPLLEWRGFTGHFQATGFVDWLHAHGRRPVELPAVPGEAGLSPGACPIHIRLTDYRTVPGCPILSAGYYARAWSALGEAGAQCEEVVLFSDEPETALGILGTALPKAVSARLRTAPELGPVETLSLMASASLLIAGNSSFSWWAGRLSHRVERAVVPYPWFVEDSMDALYPVDWLRVPAGFGEAPALPAAAGGPASMRDESAGRPQASCGRPEESPDSTGQGGG